MSEEKPELTPFQALQSEMQKMKSTNQVAAFHRELLKTLPPAIKAAGEAARKPAAKKESEK